MYQKTIKLLVDDLLLDGNLVIPVKSKSMVIIISGIHPQTNVRIQTIAKHLQQAGLATLNFDLTGGIKQHPLSKLDVCQLSRRIIAITSWLHNHSEYRMFNLVFLGVTTAAEAVVKASIKLGSIIKALVLVSGRTDLAQKEISKLSCPVLLIAAEYDFQSIRINQDALHEINSTKQMVIIAGASHFFEEPDKLKQLATHAQHWYQKFLSGEKSPALSTLLQTKYYS